MCVRKDEHKDGEGVVDSEVRAVEISGVHTEIEVATQTGSQTPTIEMTRPTGGMRKR